MSMAEACAHTSSTKHAVAEDKPSSSCEASDEEEVVDDPESSLLGRHDYWERAYTAELRNLDQHGDEGENWFGLEVMQAAVAFTDATLRGRQQQHSQAQPAESLNILDVGTGNGLLLLALADLGYKHLTGSDYSERSIALARAVADKQGRGGDASVRFVHDDLLSTSMQERTPRTRLWLRTAGISLDARFDVVTDKGTLDAVGLMEGAEAKRRVYREAVWKLLRPGGLLVVTSCNSTRDELVEELTGPMHSEPQPAADDAQDGTLSTAGSAPSPLAGAPGFVYLDHVRTYPTFRFGGREGTRVCTVAFARLPALPADAAAEPLPPQQPLLDASVGSLQL